eukprot:364904-Chlamydomonas_euryale.AAC.18
MIKSGGALPTDRRSACNMSHALYAPAWSSNRHLVLGVSLGLGFTDAARGRGAQDEAIVALSVYWSNHTQVHFHPAHISSSQAQVDACPSIPPQEQLATLLPHVLQPERHAGVVLTQLLGSFQRAIQLLLHCRTAVAEHLRRAATAQQLCRMAQARIARIVTEHRHTPSPCNLNLPTSMHLPYHEEHSCARHHATRCAHGQTDVLAACPQPSKAAAAHRAAAKPPLPQPFCGAVISKYRSDQAALTHTLPPTAALLAQPPAHAPPLLRAVPLLPRCAAAPTARLCCPSHEPRRPALPPEPPAARPFAPPDRSNAQRRRQPQPQPHRPPPRTHIAAAPASQRPRPQLRRRPRRCRRRCRDHPRRWQKLRCL